MKGNLRILLDGSETMLVKLKWPSSLSSTKMMHERWMTDAAIVDLIERYHLRVAVFKEEMDRLTRNEHKTIESLIRVPYRSRFALISQRNAY
eukprot:IDg14804t1